MSALIGVFAFTVSFVGAWVAPAGVDEAATMSAARRSLPELWRMAHNVDGVHSAYYAMMHLWFRVVPYDLALLRLPSAVAVGLAAALLVVLTSRIADGRAAVVAGVVFAVLPRTTSSGLQGRSYAFTLLAAIALTLVFTIAADRSVQRRATAWAWWAGSALLAVAGAYMFLYSALLVAAQALTVMIWQLTRRPRGGQAVAGLSWLAATAATVALVLPLVAVTRSEAGQQLYWMGDHLAIDGALAQSVFVQQYFGTSTVLAVVGWLFVAVGVVIPIANRRSRPLARAVEVSLPAVIVPIVAVIVVSVVVQPFYNARYLTFTTPFVAVLIGVGVSAIRLRWSAVVAVVLVGAIAAPMIVQQRAPLHKEGSHWVRVTEYIERERSAHPADGIDGIYYGPLPGHTVRTTEYVASSYPDAFAGMRDLSLVRSAPSIGQLWAARLPPSAPLPTDGVGRVWFVGARTSVQPEALRTLLVAAGWHEETHREIDDFFVITYTR